MTQNVLDIFEKQFLIVSYCGLGSVFSLQSFIKPYHAAHKEKPMDDLMQYIAPVGIVALTGAAAYVGSTVYMSYSRTPVCPPVDINDQSCEIPNSGGARQSRLAPPGEFTSFLYDDAKTLLEMMQRGYRISGNGNCLGYKISKTEYSWISYGEVLEI
ncbi:long-chain-fatty-acid--CoA ligase 5 [Caerostris extrusa]|uniref:Long-chain-fatty-acid--CoA ligase 5 n=1 Tax=Caerostris extrusa TaxID=172846 RepID=A0AAV4MZN8_CAEEX|nr:long-chain-fatty-acid--CoA ligase 5 [Caerostris extrusa]